MSPGLVALAVVVVAGGVVATAVRDVRVAIVGFAVAAAAAPFVADPAPPPLALAARLVGTNLGAYLLWIAGRGEVRTRGSRIGWPADALAAAAGGIAGAAAYAGLVNAAAPGPIDGAVTAGAGPAAEPLMAGFALAALAAGALLVGRDAFRLAMGMLLAILAATLIRAGVAGTPPPFEQLLIGAWVATVCAATAVLAMTAIRLGGGLEVLAGRRPAARPPAESAPRRPFRLPRWRQPVREADRAPSAGRAPAERRSVEPPGPAAQTDDGEATSDSGTISPRSAGARRMPPR